MTVKVNIIWDPIQPFGTTKEFMGTLKMYVAYKAHFYMIYSSQYVYKEKGNIIGAVINMDIYDVFEDKSRGRIEWLPEISEEEIFSRARNFIELENLDYLDFYK